MLPMIKNFHGRDPGSPGLEKMPHNLAPLVSYIGKRNYLEEGTLSVHNCRYHIVYVLIRTKSLGFCQSVCILASRCQFSCESTNSKSNLYCIFAKHVRISIQPRLYTIIIFLDIYVFTITYLLPRQPRGPTENG